MPFKQNSPGHLAAMRASLLVTRTRMARGEGYLYVAELLAAEDVVKIGFSLDPERRVRALEPAARLLAHTPCTIEGERAIHRALKQHQITHHNRIRRSELYPRSILSHPAIPEGLRPTSQGAAA